MKKHDVGKRAVSNRFAEKLNRIQGVNSFKIYSTNEENKHCNTISILLRKKKSFLPGIRSKR
jgi:hypothetical protein